MIGSCIAVHPRRAWLVAVFAVGCGTGPARTASSTAPPQPPQPAVSSQSAESEATRTSWREQDAANAQPPYKRGTKAAGDIDREAARQAYKRGLTLYQLGNYREAIEQFELAYDHAERAPLLYNIAQAYRQLGDRANAIRYYEMVVDDDPSSASAQLARDKIAELQARP